MSRARLLVTFAALLAYEGAPSPTHIVDVPEPAPVIAAPAPAPIPEDAPIGVAACDHYIDTYRRCIAEALPANERPIHTEVVEGQRLAWAQARGDDVLAASLPEACEAAWNAARVAVPRCRHLKRPGGS